MRNIEGYDNWEKAAEEMGLTIQYGVYEDDGDPEEEVEEMNFVEEDPNDYRGMGWVGSDGIS